MNMTDFLKTNPRHLKDEATGMFECRPGGRKLAGR